MAIRLTTYHPGNDIPELPGCRVEHSNELFHVYEQTKGYTPLLIVAYDGERPVAKLLSVVRKSVRLFPPSIIKRCEIYGDGEYFEGADKEMLFGEMLEYLTHEVLQKSFLIEFRNLESPLFGYKHFRANHYFPVNWLRVYNSLHDITPEERMEPSRRRQINRAVKHGATTRKIETEEELEAFLKMLKNAYSSKIRKHFPDINFFRELAKQYPDKEIARIFVTLYKGKVIGGAFCIYSGGDAYLWFSGGMRKTYPWLYPGAMAIWEALNDAHREGYRHFEFMDAGLPFEKFGYRDFILGFGGKQVSTRRWFRFRWGWLNRIASLLYR